MRWTDVDWIDVRNFEILLSGGHLWTRERIFGFQKIRGIFDYLTNRKFIKGDSAPWSYVVRQVWDTIMVPKLLQNLYVKLKII